MGSISTNSQEIETHIPIETTVYNTVDNAIDKDVRSLLFPLNLMQAVVLNPKYHIKNNCISPNHCCNKFILFCGTIIFSAAYLYRILEISLDTNLRHFIKISFLYFAVYFDFIFYCWGFFMNFFINISKTKKLVKLILTLQEVHRFINVEHYFKWTIRKCRIYVLLIFAYYIATMIYMSVLPWHIVFNLLALISLDSNLIYAIILIKVLTEKAKLWNAEVVNLKNNECNDVHTKRLFEIYLGILKCFKLVKNIFQHSVLYKTIETFFRCLENVQVMIEFRKLFFQKTPYVSFFLFSGMIKTLIIQFTLSTQVEAFYDAIKHGTYSSEHILASECTEDQKRLCKNVLRVHGACFSKMTACGLFYVDICLPLRLMTLLTNYTVVLLQFAFL